MFISAVLIFIVGISRTDSVFVSISVGMMLCATCFGCGFSRCYDYCYRRRSNTQALTSEKKYGTKHLVPVYYTDFQDQPV